MPDQRKVTLIPKIKDNVLPGSEVHTDELQAYKKSLPKDQYTHKTVNHGAGEYAKEDGTSTNQIESSSTTSRSPSPGRIPACRPSIWNAM